MCSIQIAEKPLNSINVKTHRNEKHYSVKAVHLTCCHISGPWNNYIYIILLVYFGHGWIIYLTLNKIKSIEMQLQKLNVERSHSTHLNGSFPHQA